MRDWFCAASLAGMVLLSCGRDDTPLAVYQAPGAPLGGSGGTAAPLGGTATGGEAAVAADAGSAASGGEAGAVPGLSCPDSYTIAVAGLTSRYREATTGLGWVAAERDCESDGGHLIVVDSEAENVFIAAVAERTLTDVASTHQLAWLGAGDSRTEGEFRWVTGSALSLSFWSGAGAGGAEGEPNSLFDDEDCVEIRANGRWNDDRCDAELIYVCECDGLVSAGDWCDSSQDTSCGDCGTACPDGQSCVKQQCE